MTIPEKIELIKVLYEAAYQEKKHEHNSIIGRYLTVDNQNKIESWGLFTNTLFSTNELTICCLHSFYQSYGHQNHYQIFAILNKQDEIVNKIQKENWSITKFNFLQAREPNFPIPKITFSFNNNPAEELTIDFYHIRNLQDAWNFFCEINQSCNSVTELKFYYEYFKLKISNETQAKSIEDYKVEIQETKDLIKQHKELLNHINEMVNNK